MGFGLQLYVAFVLLGDRVRKLQLVSVRADGQSSSAMLTQSNQPKRNVYINIPKISTTVTLPSVSNGHSQVMAVSLPAGWRREECTRPSGLGTGKTDVFYMSPIGQKVRTKQEMKAILGDTCDLTLFDWRSGKFLTSSQKVRRPDDGFDPTASKIPRVDGCGVLIRRTNPPETFVPVIIRSHPECKRTDVRNAQHETPHQLFWEKRFTGKHAVDPDTGEALKPLNLPNTIQTAGVPGYQPAQMVQSLVNAIASRTSPITGQEKSSAAIEKSPCVAVNPLQPMIQTYIVSDEDIRQQEMRVKELRRKLAIARSKLNPINRVTRTVKTVKQVPYRPPVSREKH
ncbi:hypothetical protein EG68_04917 [Paragonimus skrjabini miyazakii]|uniref:MBD domain-containing protein n=1 Tax=Paragonimus skrjabini miyazakii TaxID=59628 RepID=A0A8S9YXE9_9TREM|nr:hypothetical protein EG68_04917 [Paragonimus skrjabini miyazakii]